MVVLDLNNCLAESVCAFSLSRLACTVADEFRDKNLLQVRPTHAGWSLVRTRPPAKDRKKWQAGAMVKGRNEPASLLQILEIVAGKASFTLLHAFQMFSLAFSLAVSTVAWKAFRRLPAVDWTRFARAFDMRWGC